MMTPVMHALSTSRTAGEHGQAGSSYTTRQFLDDGRHVLAGAISSRDDIPHFVDYIDGRLISMNTASLLQASSSRTETLSVFCDAYGTDEGPRRFCSFRAALEFLDTQRDAVTRAGLAADRKPMEVCEELVGFLLSYERCSGQGRIPRGALVRFLDEWGHRWI